MGAVVLARHLRDRCRALDDPPTWCFVWVAVAASTGALPSFQNVSVGVGVDEDARIPWSMAGLAEMDVGASIQPGSVRSAALALGRVPRGGVENVCREFFLFVETE